MLSFTRAFPVVMTVAGAVALSSLVIPRLPAPPQRRRLKKPRHHDHEVPLPNELWQVIISYLEDKRDVISLCATSKQLRDIIEYQLYRSIDDDHLYAQYQAMLYRSLQVHRIGALVTELRMFLKEVPNYALRLDDPSLKTIRECTCRCDALDQQIGQALEGLKNLEVLHIHCTMCDDQTGRRHDWLYKLGALNLRELSFICFCSQRRVLQTAHKAFSSSCMSSVKALNWHFDTLGLPIPEYLRSLFGDPKLLPNLTILDHDGSPIANQIIETRPLTRLSVELVKAPSHEALLQGGSKFTHLNVDDTDFVLWRGDLTELNMSPYLNLVHLGVIPYLKTADDVREGMERFSSLKRIQSIEVALVHDSYDPWDEELLVELTEERHPDLKKVILKGSKFTLWRLVKDTWKKRPLPNHTSWELIKGIIDEL